MKNLIFLVSFIFFSSGLYAQEIDRVKMDSLFSNIEKNNLGIGSIAISKKYSVVYCRNFGTPDNYSGNYKTKKLPYQKKAYQIGSITKMLTAIISYQLFEENKLQSGTTIDTYFPLVPNSDKITIEHLLGHTSGLKDFVLKNDTSFFWLSEPVSKKEIMDEIVRQGIAFEPGDSTEYSNSGYYILTNILEKVCNKPYNSILEERIVQPLRLKYTKSDTKGLSVEQPYQINTAGKWEEIEDFYFPNVTGLGEVVSTPEELNRIVHSLLTSELVSTTSVSAMRPTVKARFGKGLMMFPFYENIFFGHAGDTFGTHSVVIYNEEDSVAVSICINGQSMKGNDILIGILSITYGKEYSFPKFAITEPYNIDIENLNRYEGCYKAANMPLDIKIIKKGNNLFAEVLQQPSPPLILEAFAKNRFRNISEKLEMEFDTEQGRILLKQGGQEIELITIRKK